MSGALPPGGLKGLRIGVSVAPSADLDRLGLTEARFRAVLGELARSVVTADGRLAYGGNLSEDGYTAFLAGQAHLHAPGSRPLLACVPFSEHRSLPLPELAGRLDRFARQAEIVCLDADGSPVDATTGRGAAPEPVTDPRVRHRALTGMRRHLMRRVDAHLLLGGRRGGFQGALPGLVEEALLALEAGLPVYPAAGYGGVTADIAKALGIDGAPHLPDPSDATPPDPRLLDGLARLRALADAAARRNSGNGLTDEENRRLAGSRDPGEITALAARGLARLRQDR